MSEPKLSIIIPHYGDPGPTNLLLNDIKAQVKAPRHEVVVVDDHSPDVFRPEAEVVLVRNSENLGFGTSVNAGARKAAGEILLVLNSDIRIPPDFLHSFASGFQRVTPAIVTCSVVLTSGAPQELGKRFPKPLDGFLLGADCLARYRKHAWFLRMIGEDQRRWPLREEPVPHRELDAFSGVVIGVPRAIFESLGGFDTRFFMYYEELDFMNRAAHRAIPRMQLSEPVVVHSLGASSENAWTWMHESAYVYFGIWGGGALFRAATEFANGTNLIWQAVRRLRGRPVTPLHNYRYARAADRRARDMAASRLSLTRR